MRPKSLKYFGLSFTKKMSLIIMTGKGKQIRAHTLQGFLYTESDIPSSPSNSLQTTKNGGFSHSVSGDGAGSVTSTMVALNA